MVVDAAAAIEEQTVGRLPWTNKFCERGRVFGSFPISATRKDGLGWIGLSWLGEIMRRA